ncbi:MAG TPA: CDP-alcohol phosphatidyltransferase family protein, partial [Terrimesophilobacter sp.]|nr:CDP-alcohol phosphatidyltransferase family protein [Terrimesophilobacter sp.]
MRSVQTGPIVGLVSQLALLAVLAATVGLGGAGWSAGILYAIASNALLARAIAWQGTRGLGPADWVTLTRASLISGVTALVADSIDRPTPVAVLVGLTTVALALDAVDGRVARRTRTVSTLGARFDMEVDAFLIFALSLYVAPTVGAWVLAIGLARYAFVVASLVLPWLRGSAPPRRWAKVVAAIQGVALTVAAAGLLPRLPMSIILLAALALLGESFGREVWWLWCHRQADRSRTVSMAVPVTMVSGLAIWFVLAIPTRPSLITPAAFISIPLAGLIIVAVVLIVPNAIRRATAVVVGVLLGLLAIVKALDLGFWAVFDRQFDLLNDWFYFGPGVDVLSDSIGRVGSIAVAVAAVALAIAVVIAMPWTMIRLTRAITNNRRVSIRALAALGLVWVLFAITGLQPSPGVRVASTSAIGLAYGQLHDLGDDLADRGVFAAHIAHDPVRDAATGNTLTGLRGKDVLLVFVESYGRSAVQGTSFSSGVDAVLRDGTRRLHAAGFSSRSAFLTSPTFGAGSWLAHSTLQSGLQVNSQQRYNQLLTHKRLTLTEAFSRAGWRTVFDVPANTMDWQEGSKFYGFDTLYDSRNVGYHGPKFGYAPMPDQYVLSAFHRLELAPTNRAPVMAEIDLVSSHHPWTPLPQLVEWNQVGDGTIFNGMPAQGESSQEAFQDPERVRALYGQSIQYSLNTLLSFLTTYPNPNLVVIMVGDHQAHSYVSGDRPGHD